MVAGRDRRPRRRRRGRTVRAATSPRALRERTSLSPTPATGPGPGAAAHRRRQPAPRVRGMRDEAGIPWLLPRLRAWRPPEVQVVLMLDGHPGPGRRAAGSGVPGIELRHSGSRRADTAIVDLLRARPYAERAATVVVTDDRQLSDRVRHVGVHVRRLDWLRRPAGTSGSDAAPGPGAPSAARTSPAARAAAPARHRRARRGQATPRPDAEDAQRARRRGPGSRPWKPGRGATRKRGNPRKAPARRADRVTRSIWSYASASNGACRAPDPWTAFLDWLTTVLVPNWTELVACSRSGSCVGITGPILTLIVLMWVWHLLRRPRAHVARIRAGGRGGAAR